MPSTGPGELRLGLGERGQEGSAPPLSWPETEACRGHSWLKAAESQAGA